jgi:hypothetical protein
MAVGCLLSVPLSKETKVRNTIKTMLLAVMAVLALSVVAAATASAAEIEQVPASGKFKISSGKGIFETSGGNGAIECSKDTGSGEITGAKTDKSTITFEGCSSSGISCNTSGAKSGDVVIEINSELSWLSKSAKTVGEDLKLAKEETIKCSAFETLKVKGSTICPISPTNKKTLTFTITCSQSKGKQEFTELENEAGTKIKDITETKGEGLKSFGFTESGLKDEDTLTFESEAEIKVT